MTYGLGYKPDLPDSKDHDALKALRSFAPPASVARSKYVKTLDQGGLGSCVCNATAQAVRASELRQLVEAGGRLDAVQTTVPFLSRLFLYYLARSLDHSTAIDGGTYIRSAFLVLNRLGFPPESAWPYNDNADPKEGPTPFKDMPPAAAFRLAFDQRVAAENVSSKLVKYSRVPNGAAREDAVKRGINDHGAALVFGTSVSQAFCNDMKANGGKPIAPPKQADVVGGHSMLWGGFDGQGVDTLNSWGDGYGDHGWFRMSWEYVMSDMTTDVWLVERAPLYSGGP